VVAVFIGLLFKAIVLSMLLSNGLYKQFNTRMRIE